jgi:hypothetical protein
MPESVLLENDGSARFTDRTDEAAPGLRSVGMVTDATWADATGNGRRDLVVVGEWMPITVFERADGGLRNRTEALGLDGTTGWWNAVAAVETDDGPPDFVAGNLGHNATLRARPDEPVRLYVHDFDEDGDTDPIVTRYRNGTSTPIAGRDRLAQQLGFIREKFPTYASFGDATIEEIVPEGTLGAATVREAKTFASTYVENEGDGRLTVRPLPDRAQLSPMYGVWTHDLNRDERPELVMGGNFYGTHPAQGRYDASYGTVLRRDSTGQWTARPPASSHLYLDGQVRALRSLRTADGDLLLVAARNDDTLQIHRVQVP